ncbi:hypothetical protein SANA_25480 [Gottschalkiaceae bacterium SANA]|nr:hypothetical protein SANA_25480 [Gottschalkiaceae bacterium SANA]
MKKISVTGAILLVIGFALVIFAMTTSDNPFDISKAREEKNYTFEVDDINGGIYIDEKSADISISLSTDDQIHLKTFENEEDYYEITNNHDLTIAYQRELKWFQKIIDLSIIGNELKYTLELSVPEELITNIKIDATNGQLTIDDITVQALAIAKTNGNVSINNIISIKDIDIDTSNGDIELNHVNAKEELEIHSTNGSIKLNSTDFGDLAFIETENGDVIAYFDDHGDNYTFDISSVNKKNSIEYGHVDKKGKSIIYGNGDKLFIVDTTNGKVQVTCEPAH